ncbi:MULTISPECIES: GIY-YIG nuclease family protein [Pseudomonas]|uniref:Group I intron endonuclease n=1 Tax=Pseudomonas lutea TaxID=243924 RepID=A0A9X8QLP7_9PSED|nr:MULTISPECIES: GIY-YIG nuclease family protein [Pseudomonas]SER36178.1 group I intron endonuclease [Pseudomonas lutea]
MARKHLCGLYKITSPSGKMYIGSSANIQKRINEHRGHFARGDHYNAKLRYAARKYGAQAMQFDIVLLCERETLRDLEQLAINHIQPEYNIEVTVAKVLHDFWKDPEWRKRNSQRCAVQNRERWKDPEYRAAQLKIMSCQAQCPERRASAAERLKARWLDEEYRQKMAVQSGKIFKRLFADPEYREKHSRRQSALMRSRLENSPSFREHLAKIGVGVNKRPLFCITTGEYFPGVADAAKAKGISVSVINKQFDGKPTRSALQWRYLTAEELIARGIDPAKVRTDKPSKGRKRDYVKPHKPVLCVELNKVFASAGEAHAAFGLEKSGAIPSAISKGRKALGYSWRYLAENEAPKVFDSYSFAALADLRNESRCRPVKCLDTGEVYKSVEHAALSLGLESSARYSIFDAIRGRKEKAYGKRWGYASDKVPNSAQDSPREPAASA